MLSFTTKAPTKVALLIAARIRNRRLQAAWSRAELGARSGVSPATLREFEDTGKISLERLLRLASALGEMAQFEQLLAGPSLSQLTIADIAGDAQPVRKRGRTIRRPKSSG